MISNRELKPCPFCGDSISITYNSFDKAFVIWHDHNKCLFVEPMYISDDNAKSLKEAYEIWNTRVGE